MWWLFSNKRKDNSIVYNFQLNNKIKNIEENLKNSFFNIKKDINKINTFIYHHDNSISHLKERILFLESQLKVFNKEEFFKKEIKEIPQKELSYINETEINLQQNKKPSILVKWEDLTNIQQTIFLRLGLLQVESSQRKIAMKYLAEELYPNKEYNDVRSMISDYINLLNEYGLVKKSRKGRQIFVSITENGTLFYDKNKRKKLLNIINKHKE